MDNTLESIRDHVLAEKLLNDNKLIAEFMGAVGTPKYNPTEWDVYITGCLDVDSDEENAQHFYTPDKMKYHTSWDWLMPVVDKIESIHGVFRRGSMTKGGQLHNATEKKYVIEYGMHDKVIAHVYANSRIDAEYQAVVEFIKDHNLKQDKPLKLSGEMIDVPVEEETIFFWDDFNTSRKKK